MYKREKMREYMRGKRNEWVLSGRCPYCGGVRDGKHKVCSRCRELARERMDRYRKRNSSKGGA